jgi:phytoene/squalene synthetase
LSKSSPENDSAAPEFDVARRELYDRHLNQVSRSFAFCIRELREPLRAEIGLAYLLLRVLDTVEDSPFPGVHEKIEKISEFNEFILSAKPSAEAQAWAKSLPDTMTLTERELMTDAHLLFADLHSLPAADLRIQQDVILSMARGMAYYLRQSGDVNALRLKSLTEANRYCFFVAGVVGELLTRTLAEHNSSFQADDASILRAHQFGLFLQKINVLKDQLDDEKVGRFLVPDQAAMWASLEGDAQGAIDYILSLPIEERGYRLFCSWSLFLGLASVPFIKRTWARRLLDKIPRSATEQVLTQVTNVIDNNVELAALFGKMKPKADAAAPPLKLETDSEFAEIDNLYHGTLTPAHLRALGMIT